MSTRRARRVVLAPELQRYLDASQVDLTVTDEVDAVKVRVARGIEVLNTRVAATRTATLRLLGLRVLALLVCAVIAGATGPRVAVDPDAAPLFLWVVVAAAILSLLFLLGNLAGIALDLFRLHVLGGRFSASDLDPLTSSADTLGYARTVLDEAIRIGAVR